MILGLHHAQITIPVGEEERARRFYCGLLGFREIEKPDNLKGRADSGCSSPACRCTWARRTGWNRLGSRTHLGFEVDNLAELRAALDAAGMPIEDGLPVPGYDRFEFRDPFGNRMEFLQRLP